MTQNLLAVPMANACGVVLVLRISVCHIPADGRRICHSRLLGMFFPHSNRLARFTQATRSSLLRSASRRPKHAHRVSVAVVVLKPRSTSSTRLQSILFLPSSSWHRLLVDQGLRQRQTSTSTSHLRTSKRSPCVCLNSRHSWQIITYALPLLRERQTWSRPSMRTSSTRIDGQKNSENGQKRRRKS